MLAVMAKHERQIQHTSYTPLTLAHAEEERSASVVKSCVGYIYRGTLRCKGIFIASHIHTHNQTHKQTHIYTYGYVNDF